MTLDYWQIYWGSGSTKPGRFLTKYGFGGIDTAGQVVLSPAGELISGQRSWKTGKGYRPEELIEYAGRFPTDRARKDRLKLSWFMIDPDYYKIDLGPNNTSGYCSAVGGVTGARKMRRPLARVDGAALQRLEDDQEFLRRHVRQFWWQKGDPAAPSRIVVLNGHETSKTKTATELTGACPVGKVPEVLVSIDVGEPAAHARIGRQLDRAWLDYMKKRPSNADNLTFAKENIEVFKRLDADVRRLANENRLLAPGGRKLLMD